MPGSRGGGTNRRGAEVAERARRKGTWTASRRTAKTPSAPSLRRNARVEGGGNEPQRRRGRRESAEERHLDGESSNRQDAKCAKFEKECQGRGGGERTAEAQRSQRERGGKALGRRVVEPPRRQVRQV